MKRFTLEYADLGQAMEGPSVTRVDLDLDAIVGIQEGNFRGYGSGPTDRFLMLSSGHGFYLSDRGFDRLMRVWNLP
jgi:hypothetical protein